MAKPFLSSLIFRSFVNNSPRATWLKSMAAIPLLIVSGHAIAQSLDDAVINQLGEANSTPCGILLGADNASDVLSGGLLDICSRAFPLSATSGSSGGGAGTPVSVESFLQETEQEAKRTSTSDETSSITVDSQWGFFATLTAGNVDKSITNFEDGFDSSLQSIVLGLTKRPNAKSFLGVAVNLNKQDGDFTGGGNFENESTAFNFIGGYYPSDSLSINASISIEDSTSNRVRAAEFRDKSAATGAVIYSQTGTPTADYDYSRVGFAANIAKTISLDSAVFIPSIGFTHNTTSYSAFSEAGVSGLELNFDSYDLTSFQLQLGAQYLLTINTDFGVLQPQAQAIYVQELEDDPLRLNVSFVGDSRRKKFSYQTETPDSNFLLLNVGGVMVLPGGTQLFADIESITSHAYLSRTVFNLGLSIEF